MEVKVLQEVTGRYYIVVERKGFLWTSNRMWLVARGPKNKSIKEIDIKVDLSITEVYEWNVTYFKNEDTAKIVAEEYYRRLTHKDENFEVWNSTEFVSKSSQIDEAFKLTKRMIQAREEGDVQLEETIIKLIKDLYPKYLE